MTAMSARAYAEHRGVSPKTVSRWKVLGRVLVLPDGQIAKETSDAMLDARPHTYRGGTIGGTKPGGGASAENLKLAEAIEMKEYYAGLTNKLKYERLAARLCDISLVKESVGEDYRVIRRRLMEISAEIVPLIMELPVPRNPEMVKNIIDTAMIATLDELSEDAVYDDADDDA